MVYNNNIFILEDGKVKIKGIYIGFPVENLTQALLESGFTTADNNSNPSVFKGNMEKLGICNLKIWAANNEVSSIAICTERKCNKEEAQTIFEQVKNDLHAEPGFDYHGFGRLPKSHEIDHFWDLDEGFIKIQWDGFNAHDFSFKNDDGRDFLSLSLMRPVVKDEEYWRSEVD